MTSSLFKDKFPIYSYQLPKEETNLPDVDAIIAHLKSKIEAHPIAVVICLFDHYAHTTSLKEHTIHPDIKDMKHIVFCFGAEIPTSKVAAVRPRSIGVSDLGDHFSIDFMEAPNDKATDFMKEWVKNLS